MNKIIEKGNETFVVLSRKDATDIIALLVAQLAGTNVRGNHTGACPEVVVSEENGQLKRFFFSIEQD